MREASLFGIYLIRLNDSAIPYMVTGSVASIIYGEPRLTHDIDIVLELSSRHINDLLRVFPEEEFYCPPIEVIQTEIGRENRGHFNLIHQATGFKADLYPVGRDPLHAWAMELRRSLDFNGMKIWVAPPEYVILRKLEFFKEGGSEKHLRDIKAMIAASTELIDYDFLKSKAMAIGVSEVLAGIITL